MFNKIINCDINQMGNKDEQCPLKIVQNNFNNSLQYRVIFCRKKSMTKVTPVSIAQRIRCQFDIKF